MLKKFKISNTKKTRFKLAIALEIFFGIVVMYALYTSHPDVANTTIAAMLTVGTSYLLGESYRKSDNHVEGTKEISSIQEDPKDQLDV